MIFLADNGGNTNGVEIEYLGEQILYFVSKSEVEGSGVEIGGRATENK